MLRTQVWTWNLRFGSQLCLRFVLGPCWERGCLLSAVQRSKPLQGLITSAQGGYLGYAEAGRTKEEADDGFHSRHPLFALSVPFCHGGKDGISSAEELAGCLFRSAFGSPRVRSVSWEPASMELSSGLLGL